MDQAKKILAEAYSALDEKQGRDITMIDIADVSSIADYYIITNGDNPNHVQALVENVQEKLHKAGFSCRSLEGFRTASWVLMDYGDVVVNVFSRDDRRWFDLERIWRDGKFLDKDDMKRITE
ncbi:MAG: ribosome silencing factor [Clostridiales bacterium]|nr:ribosome silencing factor [Clostridiales bacterium]